MSEAVFADTGMMFTAAAELRRASSSGGSDGLTTVTVSNAGAAETLATVTALASAVPAAIAAQLELLARTISLGALDVLTADYVPVLGAPSNG